MVKPIAKLSFPILAAGIVGYCAAKYSVNSLVVEAYEGEAKKFRSEFIIVCNNSNEPAVIQDVFSKGENFKSANLSDSFLKSKVGFIARTENKGYGPEYEFSVEDNYTGGAYEQLIIFNWGSMVFIEDRNHDNIPDRIRIKDNRNNTSITIRRDNGIFSKKNSLTFENVNEIGARKLFDLYSAKYVGFKIKNRIDELILAYEPKLEIREISP